MGGLGTTPYVVDTGTDVILERADEGNDRVYSTVDYRLGEHIEQLILTGNVAINGTGNAQDNLLLGNDAANHLDGRAGRDEMRGGLGDDVYYIDTPAIGS